MIKAKPIKHSTLTKSLMPVEYIFWNDCAHDKRHLLADLADQWKASDNGGGSGFWSLESLIASGQDGRCHLWVIGDHHTWIGTLILQASADFCEILYVFVLPQCRNLGMGKQLITTAFNQLKTLNLPEKVMLEVSIKNTSATKMYKNLGFKEIHTRKHYYSNGDDAIIMERTP
jgi:ribosomal-protein-alanine N-acetyltransferase